MHIGLFFLICKLIKNLDPHYLNVPGYENILRKMTACETIYDYDRD